MLRNIATKASVGRWPGLPWREAWGWGCASVEINRIDAGQCMWRSRALLQLGIYCNWRERQWRRCESDWVRRVMLGVPSGAVWYQMDERWRDVQYLKVSLTHDLASILKTESLRISCCVGSGRYCRWWWGCEISSWVGLFSKKARGPSTLAADMFGRKRKRIQRFANVGQEAVAHAWNQILVILSTRIRYPQIAVPIWWLLAFFRNCCVAEMKFYNDSPDHSAITQGHPHSVHCSG